MAALDVVGLPEALVTSQQSHHDSGRRALRIVMVCARYLPFSGGIETHIHEVGTRLAACGHRVTVLTTDPTQTLPSAEICNGMRIVRVKAWPKHRDWHFAPGVCTALANGDWDIVHIQGYNTFVAPLALMSAIRQDFRFVVTFHSGGHSSRLRQAIRGLQQSMLRPLIARAHHLIAVSQFEAQFFSKRWRLPRARFAVIPNGAGLTSIAPREPVARRWLVLSIGRLERYKGHHKVIEAFPDVLRQLPDARLQVVGDGPYAPQLRKLVKKLTLDEAVSIRSIPAGERQQMADLLSRAGLVVLMSEYEANPVSVMEALSMRARVLVSDTSGLRELATQGLCRAIALNARRGELAAAMLEELRSEQQPAPPRLPDWDRCTNELLGVYESVMQRPDTPDAPV
jgi:glycosyltransferase involved in cell wall biosynthesis